MHTFHVTSPVPEHILLGDGAALDLARVAAAKWARYRGRPELQITTTLPVLDEDRVLMPLIVFLEGEAADRAWASIAAHIRQQAPTASPVHSSEYLLSGEAGVELSLGDWTIGMPEDGSRADLWSQSGPLTELRGDWRTCLRDLRDLLNSPTMAAALGEAVGQPGILISPRPVFAIAAD